MFQITVPAGATNLKFVTSGGSGGDVDIFAKFNATPSVTSYDLKSDSPYRTENITFATPQAGTYYLLMYGDWSTYSGVSLTASYTPPATTTPTPTTSAVTLANGVAVNNIGGAQGSMQMFQITVPAGATNLKFVTAGGSGGDVDIFAKFNATPSVTSYDLKSDSPYRTENITFATPQAGTYYLLMYGAWSTYSGVSLTASFTPSATTSPTPTPTTTTVTLSNGVPVTGIGGAQGSMKLYTLSVPTGATNLKFVTSGGTGGDVDMYVKLNQAVSTTAFDWKSTGPTPAETVAIAAPLAGTYNVLLYGDWSTYAGVTLTASYTPPATNSPTPTPTTSTVTLSNGVPVTGIGGAQGSLKLYTLSVPSGASNLKFVTSGGSGGDVDLYVKFSLPVSTTAFDWKSTGPTPAETITVTTPQAGTYNVLLYGDWSTYAGVTLTASYSTSTASPTPTPTPAPAPVCNASSSTVTPAIASQAAWDAKYDAQYGSTVPNLTGGAETYAWQGHYWVRAFVSMAKTYGDTKYLDRAVTMINAWFANQETSQGWGASINPAQMMLDTGVIGQAVAIFSYEVWNDSRFINYRPKADAYLSKLEPILHTYDPQWVENAPYTGSPDFYVYATCGGICSSASLVMYNQGAAMAKAWLLIDRVYRLRGQTPDGTALHKADAAAAYFKTFIRSTSYGYQWDYGGSRTNTGIEDVSHAHLDLSLVTTARKFGIGGLTDTDMINLTKTQQRVLNGAAGPSDVSTAVDGSGTPTSNFDRVSIGYDWIELVDYDVTLLDKTVRVFNNYMANPTSARFYLGWAEILRKKACVGL